MTEIDFMPLIEALMVCFMPLMFALGVLVSVQLVRLLSV
jgi:hypothetical protein